MIKPHGGILVSRVLTNKEAASLLASNTNALRVAVGKDTLLDLENIAIGVYSPLKGFMNNDEFNNVVVHKRLPNGLAWTIPITLNVNKCLAGKLIRKDTVIICDEKNVPFGAMKVEDIYSIEKEKALKHIFGTNSKKHPGVRKFCQNPEIFIGGEIWLFRRNKYPFYRFNLEPLKVRKIIEARGWKTIAGFQTRNIPHRAHEFLQKIGLSLVDGILIHPIIGWKKKGDFNPETIIKSYQILIKKYYPQKRVIFSGLATAMRYAGPLEAVFHAIIRKNFGCTHFIVGRDHAGVGGFYDKYAAHRIFDKFPDLEIIPMLLNGPYYCKKCSSVVSDKICPHQDSDKIEISGTTLRKMILSKKKIPEEFLRKEIADFILMNRKKCFI